MAEWLQYTFYVPVTVVAYDITGQKASHGTVAETDADSPRDFSLQGSLNQRDYDILDKRFDTMG